MSNQGSPQKKIIFEVGIRLEAQDFTKKWYPARICRVDQSGKKALIHFEGWNHRFDEWVSFESERLRASGRSVESKEDKEVKMTHSPQENYVYQEWKVGERVLAKWVDAKFYPAKITKKYEEGSYEVLFYDGVKKNMPKTNLKPDNKKMQPLPVSKERLTQQSERMQRKTKLANARAERARKRSNEQSANISSQVPGKSREKNKKQRLESESLTCKDSTSPSDVGIKRTDTLSFDDDVAASRTSSPTTGCVEAKAIEATRETRTDRTNTSKGNTSVENTKMKEERKDEKIEKKMVEKIEENKKKIGPSIEEKENSETKSTKDQENKGLFTAEIEQSSDTLCNEKTTLESLQESNKDGDIESRKEPLSPKLLKEFPPKDSSPITDSFEVTAGRDPVVSTREKPVNNTDSDKSLPQDTRAKIDEVVQLKENDESGNKYYTPSETMSIKPQEPKQKELRSGLAKTIEQPLGSRITPDVVQVVQQPKEAEVKSTIKKPTKVSPKTQKKMKGNQNSTGEKKRATRSRSAISPRGYGYSMAVMHPQVSKPEPIPVETIALPSNQTTESINTIIDSLSEDTAIFELGQHQPESNQDANSNEVSAAPTKVKTKNFQAKKFRLDQITVKLSAQRQSEAAEVAVQSPSAFQMNLQHSPSPPLMQTPPPSALPTPATQKAPSPSAPLASHYPMDTYNVPPPLIYAPMTAQCCSNPHCQQHANVYPTPPRAQLHGGISHPMHLPPSHLPPSHLPPSHLPPSHLPPSHLSPSHLPPSHLHPHSTGYVMYPPGHGPTYDTRPPISACSCAGCTGPVYHHLPPDAGPHHESALARLMQVEQRILHAGPSPRMAHYRESAPHHGPWMPRGHPHAPQYHPLPANHEELWMRELPPHQKSPAHISPVPESEAVKVMRRWKHERSFPPVSASSTKEVIPGRTDDLPDQGTSRHGGVLGESLQRRPVSILPKEPKQQPENILKENLKSKEMEKEKPIPTQSRLVECSVDQQPPTTPSSVHSSAVTSPTYSQAMSLGAKTRKGKEQGPAPKELVIDLDHNKFKCPIAGCDKSFRKESGLDYHTKYYHSPGGKDGKRKRSSGSMRSDGTPESSPDVPGPTSVTKRRCHRSSAPGELSCEPLPGLPLPKQDTTATLESLAVMVESPAKSASIQDAEQEIEPGTEADALYCGSVESIEVEEEDVHNGDVIRCRCEETDDGGFMIQCEQCLTWQHSECVGLTEQTVPSKYLCYVCSNPKGLRRRAKYRNDFDWYRKGSLPSFSFLSVSDENRRYNNEKSLSTHDLISDVHSVDNVLKSLRVKLDILRSPNHPALGMWCKPGIKNELSDLALKSPVTLDTMKASLENSLLMVKKDPFSNGLEGPKNSLTDHNQNGIENTTIPNGTIGLVNGEVASVPSQQGPLNVNVNVNSRLNTESIEEEEAVSPLPPLVPVGGTALEKSDVLDSTEIKEKGLNNNKTETPEESLSKDPDMSGPISVDNENKPSSCDTENTLDKIDVDLMDPSETRDQIVMSNLLDDVSELQDSLESRMDVIEQQIEVLEQTQENYDQPDTTDLRKLAKDLNRIKRTALHVG